MDGSLNYLDSVKIRGYFDSVKIIPETIGFGFMPALPNVPYFRTLPMTTAHRYHHGDLHTALLQEAGRLLMEQGIEGLSLRKLAERAGVSRTAPYHHFKDKNALLCALATQGFESLDELIRRQFKGATLREQMTALVREYLSFAVDQPERYELMFGRTLWKAGAPTPELKSVAYRSFRHYTERLARMLDGRLPKAGDPLRIAQASWATVHGLCRLLIDGIYVNQQDMEAVCEQSVALILSALDN